LVVVLILFLPVLCSSIVYGDYDLNLNLNLNLNRKPLCDYLSINQVLAA
jgi:hypothetical protein